MKNKNLATIAAVSFVLCLQSSAAFADQKSGSDVVVKKNADGTVDAYDANSSAAPEQSEPAQPRIIYHLKNNPGTRRISGVSVRTNPDGSIETFDEGSAPSPIHSSGSSSHHARAHHAARSATAKSKSTAAKTHH